MHVLDITVESTIVCCLLAQLTMSKNYSDPALFSGATFDDVSIHFALARVIKEKLQLDKLTKIQDQCFNPILEGMIMMVYISIICR